MATGGRYDWDEHNERHVAAHDVEPAEVEEVLANDPVPIETRIDKRSGEERILSTGAHQCRTYFIRCLDASRKAQAAGDSF